MSLKQLVRNILPKSMIVAIRGLEVRLQYVFRAIVYRRQVKTISSKDRINVLFFVLFESVWKLERLYYLLKSDKSFNPTIVICPVVNFGRENMLETMRNCFAYFKESGYNVVKAYDEDTDSYLDVKNELSPDLIFYTSPYKGLIDDRYYIDQFKNILTCYVPYYFGEVRDSYFINHPVHNFTWKFFVETEFHRMQSVQKMYNGGVNAIVAGYPGVDNLLDPAYSPRDVWKIKDKKVKRLIWAPHHSIFPDECIYYSCFLQYSNFMLEMAQKYSDDIQIAFKPHPVLRNKLNQYWGKSKTDEYYNRWESLDNAFYENGGYIDLFLTSDAMIHDSGSFLIEYLYTGRPVMRTDNGVPYDKDFNDFALECLEYYYHASSENDVECFIINLINGRDPLKEARRRFTQEKLVPPSGVLPSQNIYKYLKNEFGKY